MTPRESLLATMAAFQAFRDDPSGPFALKLAYAHCTELVIVHGPALLAALDDAERYRWLRPHFRTFSLDMGGQHRYCIDSNIGRIRGTSIDAAIDAARKA